jgi:hypothetical protein
MGVGRFLALWEAALRRIARRQLQQIEASAFPHITEASVREEMLNQLTDAMATRADRESRWEAGWDQMAALGRKLNAGKP